MPLDLSKLEIDYLVSSTNKCLEAFPASPSFWRRGAQATKAVREFSVSICSHNGKVLRMANSASHARIRCLLARALEELREEGGVFARAARYRANQETLRAGMRRLGFAEYLPAERQSNIITAFRYPDNPNFRFENFYSRLRVRGFIIYPGKLSQADCFRIGTIGRVNAADMGDLVAAIGEVLGEIGC